MSSPLLIARTLDNALYLLPAMANRHGLITGATGTGKTVTLQKLAESFSEIGVPVFMADVKGDLTGIAAAGQSSEKLQARLRQRQYRTRWCWDSKIILWPPKGKEAAVDDGILGGLKDLFVWHYWTTRREERWCGANNGEKRRPPSCDESDCANWCSSWGVCCAAGGEEV